jgi:hypothetical protein
MTPKTLSLAALCCAVFTAATPAMAVPVNLITNGDFSLTHPGTTVSGNKAIPDSWNNIQTQTVNATVLNGAMMFSTAHPTTNVNLYKDYIWQSFTVTTAGLYDLVFDYKLVEAQRGWAGNGAKVYLDQFYASAPGVTPVVVPNLVFAQTYGDELMDFRLNAAGLNQWHLGETVALNLTAGNHTLYLSSGTGDFINQYGASVWFDNVSITAQTSTATATAANTLGTPQTGGAGPNELPEPSTLGMLALAGLGLWWSSRRAGSVTAS